MKETYQNTIARTASAVLLAVVAAAPARAADYSTAVLSHQPVAYWQFQETTATPAPYRLANSGSLGSVADAYANLSLVSGEPGKVGNAALFANSIGTAHCGSRADVIYTPALCSPAFTVEFWVKPSSAALGGNFDATGSCPISNFNPNNYAAGRVGWLFYLAPSGKWNFRLGLTSGYAANLVANSGLASAGVWQHMVATYDGATVKLYANGAQIASTTSPASSSGWVPNTGSFLRFGGTPLNGDSSVAASDGSTDYYAPLNQAINSSGNRGFDGVLDEVAIYTNALSASVISAHYAAATTPATYGAAVLADHPTGYWNFDEPAAINPDRSSLVISANSGTLLAEADGTNEWGALTGQPGPGYAGFPAADKAVAFNGASGHLDIKDATGLHFANTVTLMAWIKPAARDNIRGIISHGLDPTGAETFLRITRGDTYGTGYYYELGASDGLLGATGYYESVTTPFPAGDLGNWVFLVGTYDGTSWNLYRNGQLAASLVSVYGPADVTNNWAIGSRSNPSDEDGFRFAGSISEPAIFTSALTAADISALYNAAKVPPMITEAIKNPGTVYQGSAIAFSVWAEGSPTLGYLWTTNGVSTGVSTTNYTVSNFVAGTYTVAVTVTNAYGTNSLSVTFSVVTAPPTIVTAPTDQARYVGYPFSLSVVAGGTQPLAYFWRLGSTVVQAGSSPSYGGIASLDNAGNYSVIVSNQTGITVTSAPVVLTVLSVPTGYGGAVIADQPMAYWRLGEASGKTVAQDNLGGNDGVYNSVTLEQPGYSTLDNNTAAAFSGTDSYVGGISGTAINFTGHTNFTLEAWVKAQSGQNDEATIIAKGIGASGTTRTEQFALDVSDGVYRFFTTGGNTLYEATALEGPNGTWQHIVGVYDDLNTYGDATNHLYIFVNGQLQGTGPVRPRGLNATDSAVSIGSKRMGNDPVYDGTFDGLVDEVAVYNRALDAATIQAHYAAAYGTSLAPFIAVQPAPITNYVGLPVTLTVAAAGTVPLTYQWKKNGVDIPEGTSSTLTLAPTTYDNTGLYSVGITNSIGGVLSQAASVTILTPPTNSPAIPGLVAHLPFANNSLADVTGRGNSGVGVGHPTFVNDGVLGSALHYETTVDASSTNSSYVSLGVRPDFNFSSNVSFSVAFWIRLPANYQGGDLPFFTDATNSTFSKGFVFAPSYGYYATQSPQSSTYVDGAWAFSLFDGANAGLGGHGDAGGINDGLWHHLVYVMDRKNGGVVYLDGGPSRLTKQQGTSVKAAGDIYTGAPATIGQDPTGLYAEAGSGDIADLGVWRKALTPLEVGAIYIGAVSNRLSYTGGPITLTMDPSTNKQVQLQWEAGTLQAAGKIEGPYTNVPGVVPPYSESTTNTSKYYRVKL